MNRTDSKKGRAKPAAGKPAGKTASKNARAAATPSGRNKAAAKNRAQPVPIPAPVLTRRLTPEEIAHRHSMERFENGLALFNEGQTSRARAVFAKLTEDPVRELAERARVYLRICDQRLSRTTVQLKTADDYYNYAVGLANQGDADESEEYLKKALKLAPDADYVYYALASTYALREDVGGALEFLGKAIELNERNRYQAQNDADFAILLEDPRFTELLYPEKPS